MLDHNEEEAIYEIPDATTTYSGTVTSVTGTLPISSSGGDAPDISIRAATNAQSGAATAAQIQTLEAATAAQHTRQHSITQTLDHTSTATSGKMLKADTNGLPVDATNTDAEVAAAVTFTVNDAYVKRNKQIIDIDYTLNTGENGSVVGPITIADTKTLTIQDGCIFMIL
jgi:hypothetical protein